MYVRMYSNCVRKSVWTHVVTCVYVCMLYCFHHQSECLGLCWPPNVFCRSPTMLQPYPDSAQVMDAPDLTSAVERGVYFNWLLEIVPGTVGNVYANQLILQADRRDGLWFAGDAASSATWRPGWWCISQDPAEIRVCFAWRDGVRATERVYTRHPQFHFYSSAAAGSAAHVKLLLPLSSDGRWSRVAPILLQNALLRQFQLAPSAAANQNDGRSSPSAGGATEAE